MEEVNRIDISKETMIGLPEAARRLPNVRSGRPVNPATLWRWIHDGVKRCDGVIVRLEAIRMGGRWITSVEALQRFANAQTPIIGQEQPPTEASVAKPTVNQKKRAANRSAMAAAECEKLGL